MVYLDRGNIFRRWRGGSTGPSFFDRTGIILYCACACATGTSSKGGESGSSGSFVGATTAGWW